MTTSDGRRFYGSLAAGAPWQPVVKAWLHSTGDASSLAALLLTPAQGMTDHLHDDAEPGRLLYVPGGHAEESGLPPPRQ